MIDVLVMVCIVRTVRTACIDVLRTINDDDVCYYIGERLREILVSRKTPGFCANKIDFLPLFCLERLVPNSELSGSRGKLEGQTENMGVCTKEWERHASRGTRGHSLRQGIAVSLSALNSAASARDRERNKPHVMPPTLLS